MQDALEAVEENLCNCFLMKIMLIRWKMNCLEAFILYG